VRQKGSNKTKGKKEKSVFHIRVIIYLGVTKKGETIDRTLRGRKVRVYQKESAPNGG